MDKRDLKINRAFTAIRASIYIALSVVCIAFACNYLHKAMFGSFAICIIGFAMSIAATYLAASSVKDITRKLKNIDSQ